MENSFSTSPRHEPLHGTLPDSFRRLSELVVLMTSTATRIIINIKSCIASTRRSGCSGGSGASGAGVGPCASGGGSGRSNKSINMIAYICIRIDISINIRISMHHL